MLQFFSLFVILIICRQQARSVNSKRNQGLPTTLQTTPKHSPSGTELAPHDNEAAGQVLPRTDQHRRVITNHSSFRCNFRSTPTQPLSTTTHKTIDATSPYQLQPIASPSFPYPAIMPIPPSFEDVWRC
ncbi:unnamed protein product [Vicia faba]|uniref:Secreted protein n=1 Tax=Vicia faba TaxID=3906 RepID=A0AAV0Z2T6_VICFA|nr:unnamed protein product [Vicia faba]